jgi:hypothetical protein
MLDMKRTLQAGQGMTVHHSITIKKIPTLECNKLHLDNMEGLKTPIPYKELTPRTASTKKKNKLLILKQEVEFASSDVLEEGDVNCLVEPLKSIISFFKETDNVEYGTEIGYLEKILTRSEKGRKITAKNIENLLEIVKDLEPLEYTKETNTPASSVKSSGYTINNNRLEYNEERETSFNPFIQPNSMNRMTAAAETSASDDKKEAKTAAAGIVDYDNKNNNRKGADASKEKGPTNGSMQDEERKRADHSEEEKSRNGTEQEDKHTEEEKSRNGTEQEDKHTEKEKSRNGTKQEEDKHTENEKSRNGTKQEENNITKGAKGTEEARSTTGTEQEKNNITKGAKGTEEAGSMNDANQDNNNSKEGARSPKEGHSTTHIGTDANQDNNNSKEGAGSPKEDKPTNHIRTDNKQKSNNDKGGNKRNKIRMEPAWEKALTVLFEGE